MFTSVRLNSSSLLLVPCSAAMLQFLRFLCEYMVEYILYFHYIVEKTFFFFRVDAGLWPLLTVMHEKFLKVTIFVKRIQFFVSLHHVTFVSTGAHDF